MNDGKSDAMDFDVIKAPSIKPAFKLWSHQWIGLPLLFSIPILALSGVLGESQEKLNVISTHEQIEISGEYPKRLHYGKAEKIELTVTNRSEKAIDDLEVQFEDSYLKKFSDLDFTPPSSGGYRVSINKLAPGESRSFRVSMRGEEYGYHSGKIQASVGGRSIASLDLKSFVFP